MYGCHQKLKVRLTTLSQTRFISHILINFLALDFIVGLVVEFARNHVAAWSRCLILLCANS